MTLAGGSAWAEALSFKVPAQPATTGVTEFARQAGVQMLVARDAALSRRTAAVVGQFSLAEGLNQLLAGSGLVVAANDGHTITLAQPRAELLRARWASGAADFAAPAATDAPAPSEQVEEVIVTGTRQARTVTTSLAPIDVLSAAALQKTGKLSTRDLIATLVPSANVSSSGAGASFAFKTISLRGLSGDHVLVLVNGKRRHNTAVLFVNGTTQNGQSPPDLDLIPASAIDHVEVLRDGASAQYGSDALAGVINIILKDQAGGGSALLMGGQTAAGDGETGQAALNGGFKLGEDGYLNLTFDARSTKHTDRGKVTPNLTQLYFPLAGGVPDPREATADRHTSHPGQPEVQLYSFDYNAGYRVTPDVLLYSFGTVSSRNSLAYLTFRNPNSLNNNVAVYPDGFTPRLKLADRDYQFAFGAKGSDLAGFNWDLSTTVSRNNVSYFEDSLNASLGPASPSRFFLGKLRFKEWTTNLDLTHDLDLGLAKPLLVAFGAEYRNDEFMILAGQPESYINGGYRAPSGPLAGQVTTAGSQGVTGFPTFAAGSFSRNNKSAYIDFEQTLSDQLDVSVAGRWEDYSDFGKATTAKASARFEPVRGYAIRGTISSGFRAPSLQQEHYASSSTIGVRFPAGTILFPVQLLPPDNPAAQALGAKPLRPEKSTSYSVGFVAQPMRGLNLTLDLYQIDIKNRIMQSATLGPNTAVSNALASVGLDPNQAVFYYANAADTRTRGVDVVAEYVTDFGDWGSVAWSLSANLTDNKFTRIAQPPPALAAAGLVLIDRVRMGDFTVGQPRDKEIASALYTRGPFQANLRVTSYGKVIQRTALAANDDTISRHQIVDLDLAYKIRPSLRASIGANNLFDVYPDVIKVANRGNPPFSYYNQYSPWGFSGGFYYAKLEWTF
ncbi:TonB-dependent receptor [Phenylobacterium sp. LjRoot225]|uniref:TonB-dependent receptor domain-containing protein n=1 Tax=Phenylobacterium sp. LjRoot225 TaxID=3342285 RepID=UPI003ED16981